MRTVTTDRETMSHHSLSPPAKLLTPCGPLSLVESFIVLLCHKEQEKALILFLSGIRELASAIPQNCPLTFLVDHSATKHTTTFTTSDSREGRQRGVGG